MRDRGEYFPRVFTIVVAANVGSQVIYIIGEARGLNILPPAESSTFDYSLEDSDGRGLIGQENCIGNVTEYTPFPLEENLQHTLSFANATNGTYSIKIWFDQS